MIRLRSVTKRFDARRAIGPVDLAVAPGEAVAILGPSGSGKTTLLRLVAGLERPDAGTVELDGRVASSPDSCDEPCTRGIGFVFQTGALWPHLTVAEHIAFSLPRPGGDEARARVAELLTAVDLAGFGPRMPSELSGGEAQRVAVCRALAPKPQILLLDEPVSHLDPEAATVVLALVKREAEATRATILLVTHEPGEAAALGGRRVHMRSDGRLDGDLHDAAAMP